LRQPDARRWVLIAAVLGSSMAFIDATAVNVILPVLQNDLRATVAEVQWVIEAYQLFLAALILLGGALGDRFGRRRVFVAGVFLFALASAACGFAPSAVFLIAARAVQGVGGALLTPGSLALIARAYEDTERGAAIGSWSAFSALTSAAGPVLGGWLAQHLSWRAIFFLNAPIAAAVLAICLLRVKESRAAQRPGLDPAGAMLATLGLGGITYGLIESPQRGFADATVLGSLVAGAIASLAFIVVESRARAPMLPLDIFRSRAFAGANLLTLFLYGALGGFFFFLPFDLIQLRGYSPTQAGAALLPFAALLFAGSRWAGALAVRFGARKPLTLGPALAAAGLILMALSPSGGTYWTSIFPGLVLLGVGMTTTIAPLTTTVMSSAPQERAGLASGVNNAVARGASLLAIAVIGAAAVAAFSARFEEGLAKLPLAPQVRSGLLEQRSRLTALETPSSLPAGLRSAVEATVASSFRDSFRLALLLAAALALVSGVVGALTIREKGRG
jgi:EmrB/QacA subfamily drug resistance transporter